MGSFSRNLGLLALGAWLGIAVFFVADVAHTVFNPDVAAGLSKPMAASISGAILRRFYRDTYILVGIASFFLLLAWLRDAKGSSGPKRAFFLCLLVLVINAVSDFYIAARISKIYLDKTNARGDPVALEQQFRTWHRASEVVYGGAVIAGLLAAACLLPAGSAPKPKKPGK